MCGSQWSGGVLACMRRLEATSLAWPRCACSLSPLVKHWLFFSESHLLSTHLLCQSSVLPVGKNAWSSASYVRLNVYDLSLDLVPSQKHICCSPMESRAEISALPSLELGKKVEQ